MISYDTQNETNPGGAHLNNLAQDGLGQYAPPVLSTFLTQFRRALDHIDAYVRPIVMENRNRRKNIVDIEKLRTSGFLDADETYIPLRIIDENVSKELIPYIKYLITSPRAAIFKDVDNDQTMHAQLEADFTRVFRYENWILPLFRTIDCSTLNGYGCVEINYDSTKPGRFSFYYVSKENLIYPQVSSLESAPFVSIRLKLSCIDLKRLSRAERFNTAVAARAIEDKKDVPEYLFEVYKTYHKLEGVVWISYHIHNYETEWFLTPEPFNNGVYEPTITSTTVLDPITGLPTIVSSEQWNPVEETRYPIFPYIYKLTDDEMLSESEGRGQLDASKQEAESTLVTTYVNASLRASTSYFCVDKQDPATVDIALMDFKLARNSICNQPLRAITHQFPPQDLMRVANMIDVRSKAEIGQTVWAADNRVDSRKTAEEMRLAAQSKQELDSVAVLLFSLWCGDTLNYCWRIVKSAALRGEIAVGRDETGAPDRELLNRNFLLLPAGDVDVIEKHEQLSKRFQAWPIVSTNPMLAQEFLMDILRDMFPRDYKRYAETLHRSMQMQSQQSLAPMLLEMLESLLQMPQNAAIAQQYGPKIQELKQSMQ